MNGSYVEPCIKVMVLLQDHSMPVNPVDSMSGAGVSANFG